MALFDVTLTLMAGMATYPGESGPSLRPIHQISQGDAANVSELRLGVHSGTHIDAPVHFYDGRGGVDRIAIEALVGPAVVLDTGKAPAVTAAMLAQSSMLSGAERVLFKTRNGAFADDPTFHPDFTFIAPDAATWLVQHGVRLVGIDYLSVEQFNAPEPLTHRTLLGAAVVIVEGLDLRAVPEGHYEVMALPIKLKDADGASARVLLRD